MSLILLFELGAIIATVFNKVITSLTLALYKLIDKEIALGGCLIKHCVCGREIRFASDSLNSILTTRVILLFDSVSSARVFPSASIRY